MTSTINENNRLEIRRALSELFLDTEIDQSILTSISKTIKQSDYSFDEVEAILWAEVYPVLKQNLASPAGIWEGWSDSWLLENLEAYDDPQTVRENSIYAPTTISKEIEQYWQQIKQ